MHYNTAVIALYLAYLQHCIYTTLNVVYNTAITERLSGLQYCYYSILVYNATIY